METGGRTDPKGTKDVYGAAINTIVAASFSKLLARGKAYGEKWAHGCGVRDQGVSSALDLTGGGPYCQ